jgi:phage terminase large subunit
MLSPSIDSRALARKLLPMARFEPLRFQREVLGVIHQPWQEEATEAVFDYVRWRHNRTTRINHSAKRFFTVRAMHGPGKTYWGASLIHTFGMAFPKARIPCIAPKMDQLRTRLWLELRKVRDSANKGYQGLVDVQATTMKFLGQEDWLAFAQTASKAENLAGIHGDYILVFVDEASGITEALWPTIFGAVSTGKIVVLVMISNPSQNAGTFFESWTRESVAKSFHHVAISLEKAPRVDRSWVKGMAEKYGEKSPIFKIRCLGEFADAGENQLIPLQWILDAITDGPVEGDGSHPKLRVSVDVADGGLDETVITVMRHYQSFEVLLKMKRCSFPANLAPLMAADTAEQMFYAWGGVKGTDTLVVDAMGVGTGTAGTLRLREHSVVPHMGGASSANPERWRNRRVQGYINLRDALRDKRLRILSGAFEDRDREDFQAQLCSIERDPNTDRVEDLVTKEAMKRDGIKSPDIADSLAMQYSTIAPKLVPRSDTAKEVASLIPSRSMEGYAG